MRITHDRLLKKLKPIYIVIVCWLLFMVIDSLKKSGLFSNGPFFWYQYFPGILIWIGFTLPALWLFRKTAQLNIAKRVPLIFGMGIAIGVIKNVTSWFVFYVEGVISNSYTFSLEGLAEFYDRVGLFYYMEAVIIAWVMLIIFFITELYQRFKTKSLEAAELESQLAKAQLESLRIQLQPHFLFNAHNTVSMLIRTQQYDQATEMISKISDLLRTSLSAQETQFVTVSEELEIIKAYLEIEQIRFEDHLTIEFDTDDAANGVPIPHLILQPIIENAFKHGISKNLGQSRLIIQTKLHSNQVELSVYNTGPALPEGWLLSDHEGIGLSNTRLRLTKLYGQEGYGMNIINDGEGVSVKVKVPKKQNSVG